MKVFSNNIRLATTEKDSETNITDLVEAIVLESSVKEGSVLINTGHTTAAIHLNYADRDLEEDYMELLTDLVPNKPTYRHNKGDYGRNADAHLKSIIVGNWVTLPVSKSRVSLGEWQAIYFSEFNGPRNRLISVKVMGI